MIEESCDHCGILFFVKSPRKNCDHKCIHERALNSRMGQVDSLDRECVKCGDEFQHTHRGQSTCSRCRKKPDGRTCLNCDKSIFRVKSRRYCSPECQEGYLSKRREFVKKKNLRSLPKRNRWQILHRDEFSCAYCGKSSLSGNSLTVDHIVPVSSGGGHQAGNLITCCGECNGAKWASPLSERALQAVLAEVENRNLRHNIPQNLEIKGFENRINPSNEGFIPYFEENEDSEDFVGRLGQK